MPKPPNPATAVTNLSKKSLFVGIPAENDARPGDAIGNAALAYVHEFGSPAHNIPARPFLRPAVRDARREVEAELRKVAEAALKGDDAGVNKHLATAGQILVRAVQLKIQDGIPPLLKPNSIRRSRTKSRRGGTPGNTTPLYDTGDMLRSITYVVKK